MRQLRPSKCEANSQEMLTWAKKGESSNTSTRKLIGFSFWPSNSLSHSLSTYVCWSLSFFLGGGRVSFSFSFSNTLYFFYSYFAPLSWPFGSSNLLFPLILMLNHVLDWWMSLLCCLKSSKPLVISLNCTWEFNLDDMSSQVQIFIHIVHIPRKALYKICIILNTVPYM